MLNLHLQESLRPPKRPSKAKNGQNFTFLAISGSVLSDFANFPTSPLKYEKNAAFGSHVALSVLQIDLWSHGKSTYQSTTKNSPKPIPLPSPLFFSIFLVDSWTQIIQGSSVGHISIHFRGLRGLRRAPKPKILTFLTKKKFLRKCSYLRNQTSHRVGSGVKTPLDQGLRAWPFRLSVPLLVSMIA